METQTSDNAPIDSIRCSACRALCKAADVFDSGGEFLCRECVNARLGKDKKSEPQPTAPVQANNSLVVIGWQHILVPFAALLLIGVGAFYWGPSRKVIDGWIGKVQPEQTASKKASESQQNSEATTAEAPISPDVLSRLESIVGPQATEPEGKLPDAVKIIKHEPDISEPQQNSEATTQATEPDGKLPDAVKIIKHETDVSEPEKKLFRAAVRAGDEIVQSFHVGQSLTVIKELDELYGVQWKKQDGSLDTGWIAKAVVEPVYKKQGTFCSFADGPSSEAMEYAIAETNSEFMLAVADVMKLAGLPQNFLVHSAPGIGNAMARVSPRYLPDGTLHSLTREIQFDPEYIAESRSKCGGSKWAALSIAAHEVGHHLSNHMLQIGNRRKEELEADRFSGHLMAKMGATLEEALELSQYHSQFGSVNHPPRSKRLEAVAQGFAAAKAQLPASIAPVVEIKTKSGRTKVIRRAQCKHRTKKNYYAECEHRIPCTHRVKCTHKVLCRHYSGAFGFKHTHDFAHEKDYLHPYDTRHRHHAKAREGTLHEYDEKVEWK